MIEFGSLLQEFFIFSDASPPQGLSEARRGKEVLVFLKSRSSIRRGAPFGAAALILSGGMGVSTPIIIHEKIFS
ncbi:MAG: hypothetical protein CVV30_04630 [Methanomicrobiales archaeon HGW-Methanomicrobiales-1]|nr:MAG: hypothetical protein CVV30_04630 [Methanomicrobiales archaeon HGW-Methanomicrobiales-1]